MLKFEKADNADAEFIKPLVFSILEEYGLNSDPSATDSDLDDIEQSYFLKGGYFEKVLDNNQVIACWGLFPLENDIVELRKMYMVKDYRGKGIGKRLLERSLNKASELGFKRVTLETAGVLKEAIGLYEKFGFKEFFPEHISCRCDQAYYLDL